MTTSQLAAIAYQLGVIDIARSQLGQLMSDLSDEVMLSVKLELTLRAFDERAEEYRKILNEYANETLIPTTQNLEP